MERLLDRNIEVHGPEGTAEAGLPGPPGQGFQAGAVLLGQTVGAGLQHQAATGGQELLLVNGLVSPALLQPRRPIGTQQQQGDGAPIRLDHGRQQVGHGAARRGDHRSR